MRARFHWRTAVLVGLSVMPGALACRNGGAPAAPRASGYVEATEVRVSPEVGGRIVELKVAEGDRVEVGALIARLDTADAELTIRRAEAERDQAVAQLRLLEAGARPEEIRQAQAQLDSAEADVRAAAAELQSAEADLQRFEALLAANAGSRKQRDDALTRRDVAIARVAAARGPRAGRGRSAGARPVRRAPGGSRRRARAHRRRRRADRVAREERGRRRADVAGRGHRDVEAGRCRRGHRAADAGRRRHRPRPRLGERLRGRARGAAAQARAEGRRCSPTPGSGSTGPITFISPKAEFTPRNVQTADERSQLVYRIKVSADNQDGVLKPGMPVEAELVAQATGPAMSAIALRAA